MLFNDTEITKIDMPSMQAYLNPQRKYQSMQDTINNALVQNAMAQQQGQIALQSKEAQQGAWK
jgi:hypothetical protein